MEVIMQLVSKLLLIFFMLGLVSVCLPQKVLAERKIGVAAFHLHQSKANQDDANSQFNLAIMYENGAGTPMNTKQAFYWYTKAAEQGHVEAQYKLGSLYQFSGDYDFPQDYKQAFYWYTKAAEQGHIFAQYKLGRLYRFSGDDRAPKDYKQAFFWYTKAAEQGHIFAKDERDKMLEKMSQSQIGEVLKLSKELYKKINNKAQKQNIIGFVISAIHLQS
jgi:TPR repeat protein